MPRRGWVHRVQDIIDAVDDIVHDTAGMDQAAFVADPRTQRSVYFTLVILGEAANSVPDHVQAAHPEVPWKQLVANRNFLTHVYHAVEPQVVWRFVKRWIPDLVTSMRAIQRAEAGEPETELGDMDGPA